MPFGFPGEDISSLSNFLSHLALDFLLVVSLQSAELGSMLPGMEWCDKTLSLTWVAVYCSICLFCFSRSPLSY